MNNEIRALVEQNANSIEEEAIEQDQSTNEGVADSAASSNEEVKEDVSQVQSEGQMPSEEPVDNSLNLNNIDPSVREYVEKLDDVAAQQAVIEAHNKIRANFDRKQTELGEKNKIVNRLGDKLKGYGVENIDDKTLGQIEHSIDFADKFYRNPAQTLQALAKEHNVNLNDDQTGTSSDSDVYDFTENERLIDEKYNTKVSQLEKKLQDYESREQAKLVEERNKLVLDLENEVDGNGNKIRPYFNEVRDDMSFVVSSMLSNPRYDRMSDRELLRQAYETAVYSNQELRNKVVTNQVNNTNQEQVTRAKQLNGQTIRSKKVETVKAPPQQDRYAKTNYRDLVGNIYDSISS